MNNKQQHTHPSGEVDFFADRLLEDLNSTSPLRVAYEAQDESAKVGFDFKNIELVMERVADEWREATEAFDNRDQDFAHFRDEVGDCFFALVNLCRHANLDPEELIRENTAKYLKRCQFIEHRLKSEDKIWADLSLEQVYAAWREAKKSGL